MANILLVGPRLYVESFRSSIVGEHAIVTIMTDEPSDNLERPGACDAIFVLEWKRVSMMGWLHVATNGRDASTLLFVNCLTSSATNSASKLHIDLPTLGISFTPASAGAPLVECARALQTSQEDASRGETFLRELLGRDVETVVDRVGLVSARVLAMVINEAAFALMEGVADANDIDTAMKLGTNYPEGPLAWCDRIGADVVLEILDALYDEYREERYRPCVLLRQLVRARQPFHSIA